MKIVLFIILSLFIFFLLLLLPIKAEAKFVVDLESRSVYFSLLGARMSLMKGKIYLLEDMTPSIITDRIFFMNMKQSNIEKYYMITSLFKKIKIKEVTILADGGVQDDAFLTSMIIGTFNALFASIAPLSKRKDIIYDIKLDPIYENTNLNIAGKTSVKISIFNLIVAIVTAKIKTKTHQKEKQYV
ncbi:MAG: hypothetical protein J6J23_00290 [Clostridia bacterium]|nr:hypothetical protein [Clostridia bacterium]